MPAAQDGRAGAGPRRAVPELLHPGMRAGVEVAAEGRTEVVGVAGRVGDQVIAPVIEDPAVRIGEAVGDVARELAGVRLVAVDRAVPVADRTVEGFHVGPVENAVAQIDRAAGLQAHRVRLVVRVRGIEPVQHPLLPVGLAVAVGVAHEPEVGRLHQQHAVLVKLEAGRAIQAVEEGRDLRRLAGLRVEVDDQQLVEVRGGRRGLRIGRPRGDPQAALGVEVHLHRIDQFGKVLLGGDQLDLAAGSQLEVLDRLLAGKVGHLLVAVRRDQVDLRQVVVLHHQVAALGDRPDPEVAVGGLDVALRQLLAEDLRVGHALVSDPRAAAEDVVLIDGPVAVMPLGVLVDHRLADLADPRLVERRRLPAENRAELHRRELAVAFLRQVDAIDGERRARLGVEVP